MIRRIIYRCKRKSPPALGTCRYDGFSYIYDRLMRVTNTRYVNIPPVVPRDSVAQVVVLGGSLSAMTLRRLAEAASARKMHMALLSSIPDLDFTLEVSRLADFGNMTIPMPKERKIPVGQSPRQDPYDLCNCDSGKRYRKCCGRGRTW